MLEVANILCQKNTFENFKWSLCLLFQWSMHWFSVDSIVTWYVFCIYLLLNVNVLFGSPNNCIYIKCTKNIKTVVLLNNCSRSQHNKNTHFLRSEFKASLLFYLLLAKNSLTKLKTHFHPIDQNKRPTSKSKTHLLY